MGPLSRGRVGSTSAWRWDNWRCYPLIPHRPRVIKALPRGRRWGLIGGDMRDVESALEAGELVVYPTETVYGLGADPFNPAAVASLYSAKGRPQDQPVSIAVASLEEARRLAHFTSAAEYLWQHFLPGPLTVLLRPREEAPGPPITAGGLIGLRVPDHTLTIQLLRTFGPLTATSANRHGGPSPREASRALADLGESVAVCIDAGPCPLGVESTVVDASEGKITVKREGAVTPKELSDHG